ncbi:MAG TPA: roadblock/LC7 domain-containing protein, partial [Streptomyces sp.]|nr:roadblock/LC7 domain-containing protein [Streptomyces sp.]
MRQEAAAHDQSWMLSDVADVPGVQHAVVLSADGLVRARTDDLGADDADTLAAAAAGLQSLGSSLAGRFGEGAPKQHMIEWKGGFLFLRGAGDGSRLAVITSSRVDPGVIASQMVLQVQRFGDHQGTPPRERSIP